MKKLLSIMVVSLTFSPMTFADCSKSAATLGAQASAGIAKFLISANPTWAKVYQDLTGKSGRHSLYDNSTHPALVATIRLNLPTGGYLTAIGTYYLDPNTCQILNPTDTNLMGGYQGVLDSNK